MVSYQRYMLSDIHSGIDLSRDKWLLPGLVGLTNCYLDKGAVVKRLGYATFGTGWTGSDPVLGIFQATKDSDGTKILLAADSKYLWKYTPGTGAWAKVDHATLTTGQVFTGTNGNLFSTVSYKDVTYITNGMPSNTGSFALQRYTAAAPGTFDHHPIDLVTPGGTTNYVTTAAFITVFHGRLLLFRFNEGTYPSTLGFAPSSVRWSTIWNPNSWPQANYLNAKTSEWIRGIAFCGDELLVFFDQSVWRLRYTADASLPFEFERITGNTGCSAQYTPVEYQERVYALGKAGVVVANATGAQRIDQQIPDNLLTYDQTYINRSHSKVVEELRQIWFAVTDQGATTPDKILVFNYDEAHWALFDSLAFTCFGETLMGTALTWANIGGTWDQYPDQEWVSQAGQVGYPIILGGGATGGISRINTTRADSGAAINATIETGQINPFKDGSQVRLGHVDILAGYNPGTTVTVALFVDYEDTAYQETQITFDDADQGGKGWYRVESGVTGIAHRIKITNNEANDPFRIHAIAPAFKAVGGRTLRQS